MLRRFSFVPIAALLTTFFFSCKKSTDSNGSNTLFYGKWKTSYNDTIEFIHENGKDYVIYDESMSPAVPFNSKKQFRYSLGKLHIEMPTGWPAPGVVDFRKLDSFNWIITGQSFGVQGVEWFLFMSSSSTYFTFTKIP